MVVGVGYFLGTLVVFLPFVLLLLVTTPIAGNSAGEQALGPMLLLVVPLILAGQGAVFGAVICFGVWIYTRFREVTLDYYPIT